VLKIICRMCHCLIIALIYSNHAVTFDLCPCSWPWLWPRLSPVPLRPDLQAPRSDTVLSGGNLACRAEVAPWDCGIIEARGRVARSMIVARWTDSQLAVNYQFSLKLVLFSVHVTMLRCTCYNEHFTWNISSLFQNSWRNLPLWRLNILNVDLVLRTLKDFKLLPYFQNLYDHFGCWIQC